MADTVLLGLRVLYEWDLGLIGSKTLPAVVTGSDDEGLLTLCVFGTDPRCPTFIKDHVREQNVNNPPKPGYWRWDFANASSR